MTYQPRHTYCACDANGNQCDAHALNLPFKWADTVPSPYAPRHGIQVEQGRYLMEFAHRNTPMFLMFYANRVNPFRPIHSDVAMCRVLMAAGHGVTDTQALILASRQSSAQR